MNRHATQCCKNKYKIPNQATTSIQLCTIKRTLTTHHNKIKRAFTKQKSSIQLKMFSSFVYVCVCVFYIQRYLLFVPSRFLTLFLLFSSVKTKTHKTPRPDVDHRAVSGSASGGERGKKKKTAPSYKVISVFFCNLVSILIYCFKQKLKKKKKKTNS